jgi:hypothetical protein
MFERMSDVRRLAGLLIAGAALFCALPAAATQQGEERRAARDTRQDTRQDSRQDKVDCRQANQKGNAACRHDKRDTKQEGRKAARDIKY